jgi:soluble P-type ATPase
MIIDVPGGALVELDHLVLDVNGTLTDRGTLIEGARELLADLATQLEIHLVSADTFGGLEALARQLAVRSERVLTGDDKRAYVGRLGVERCAAIGNGANDAAMLEAVALGIAVIGPEGASGAAVAAAVVVCGSITEALDLLLDSRALAATLRP